MNKIKRYIEGVKYLNSVTSNFCLNKIYEEVSEQRIEASIMNSELYLKYPSVVNVSPEAEVLLKDNFLLFKGRTKIHENSDDQKINSSSLSLQVT